MRNSFLLVVTFLSSFNLGFLCFTKDGEQSYARNIILSPMEGMLLVQSPALLLNSQVKIHFPSTKFNLYAFFSSSISCELYGPLIGSGFEFSLDCRLMHFPFTSCFNLKAAF